jgi:hypothetical protein
VQIKEWSVEMVFRNRLISQRVLIFFAPFVTFGLVCAFSSSAAHAQTGQQTSAQSPATARPVGTIKSISGNTIMMTVDVGGDTTVQVQDGAKLLRIAPGQKDLKDAAPIQMADLQPGDRILVRGKLAEDGKLVLAASVIAMKKADIADKQTHEREEWQKHGLGGLVTGVDAAAGTISVSLPSTGEKKTVAVHFSQNTILRRYASGSVKFDDAKPAPLDQIKPGDQLRARGTRSADGAALAADEIVSGTFRNIAGPISALDASAGTITIQDLVSKKSITVKITSESQLRKLPPPVAQRIAARLKEATADGQPSSAGSNGSAAGANAAPASSSVTPAAGSPGAGAPGGTGRSGGAGNGDLQQMINRLPAAALSELQKGDAVMVVSTEGGGNAVPVVITLLGGVEPILEASPKSSASTILSPWSLGSGGGEAAAP